MGLNCRAQPMLFVAGVEVQRRGAGVGYLHFTLLALRAPYYADAVQFPALLLSLEKHEAQPPEP